MEKLYTEEDLKRVFFEGAEYAWEKSSEGFNGEHGPSLYFVESMKEARRKVECPYGTVDDGETPEDGDEDNEGIWDSVDLNDLVEDDD